MTKIANYVPPELPEPELSDPENLSETLLQLLSSPNIASKESVIRTYDHEVKGNTVLKPLQGNYGGPNDSAVLKPMSDSWKGTVSMFTVFPAVSEDKLIILVELFQTRCFLVFCKEKPTFAVCHRYLKHSSFRNLRRKYTLTIVFMLETDPSAIIAWRMISGESRFRKRTDAFKTGKKTSFNEHLETVADSEDQTSFVNEGFQFLSKLGNHPFRPYCSRPDVIPV